MKLVRYGRAGAERPGLIAEDGTLRDLSRVVKDITPDVLSPAGMKRLRAVKTARLPVVRGRPRLGCPLASLASHPQEVEDRVRLAPTDAFQGVRPLLQARAKRFDERPVGRLRVLVAAALNYGGVLFNQTAELAQEPRFAHAGVTADQHEARPARYRLVDCALQQGKFTLTPDKAPRGRLLVSDQRIPAQFSNQLPPQLTEVP